MALPLLSDFHGSFLARLLSGLVPLCLFLVLTGPAAAQTDSGRYLAEIELHNEAELLQLLRRAEQLAEEGVLQADTAYPVRFVLHGPEVRVLLVENYSSHMATVDLARKLSEQGLVDVKVCETWMGRSRVSPEQLPSFIGTVPYAPTEMRRLLNEEQYVYF